MTTADLDLSLPTLWPDVARKPSAPLRARVARQIVRRAVRDMDVRVRMPDGAVHGAGGPESPVLEILDAAVFDRLGADLKIGLGEAYMAGEWRPGTGTDLGDLLTPFAARVATIVPPALSRFRKLVEPRHPSAEENDRRGARANISRHYDLSNELFSTFLDETLSYSSAWFEGDQASAGFDDLAGAQRAKVHGVLDFARVGPGSRVLEIGSGWGQLAIQAAERGATVRTITLSREQQELAQRRIAEAGLAERVDVVLQDYREVEGEFDAVVSVEMIEAVGERYWPTYFGAVSRLLVPGGSFGLQAITMPHERMLASRHAYGWIHKYVFPGGLIPSVEAIEATAGAQRLSVTQRRELGPDYARTLQLWRDRFTERHAEVEALGFDPVFRRMWEFYLAYSEAGFRSGHLNVWQLSLTKES